MGHERIAHISGPPSFRSAHERRRGFREALAERGLKLRPSFDREGAYTFDSGIAVSQFYQWQKTFFEQGAAAFETTTVPAADPA